MRITFFGSVWAVMSFICLFLDIKYTVALLMISCVLQASSVFYVGDLAVVPFVFTSAFFILRSLLAGIPVRRLSNQEKSCITFFTVTIIVTVFALVAFHDMPIGSRYAFDYNRLKAYPILTPLRLTQLHVTNTIFLTLACIDFVLLEREKKRIDSDWMIQLFDKILIFVIIVGLVQVFVTNTGKSTKLLEVLFYSKDDNPGARSIKGSGNQLRLFSTFSEPSYCGAFLSASFWFVYTRNNRLTKLGFATFVALLLSRSVTAYAACCAGAVIYCVVCRVRLRDLMIGICSALVIFLILWRIGYLDVMFKAVFNKVGSVSDLQRSAWNREAWRVFCKTFFIGAGFSSVRASSLLLNSLGQVGIIGTLSFAVFILSLYKYGMRDRKITTNVATVVFLLVNVAGGVIACPDYTLQSLWVGMYLVVLCHKGGTPVHLENSIVR